MGKLKHINLASSALAAGLIIASPFLLNPHDTILQILGFAIFQMTLGFICVLMIIMRMTFLLINRKTWLYYFSGTFQVFLLITDIILLITNHNVTTIGMLAFICLNTMFASVIFIDIYK